MEPHELSRVRIATAVALASIAGLALILSAAPATGGLASLRPDLVTLPIGQHDLAVTRAKKATVLRLTNEVANRGNGPLEIFPSAASPNCDDDGRPSNDRVASQRVFTDANADGLFDRGTDGVASETPVGCMRFHPAHDHWHVLDFARYELRRDRTARLAAASRKVGFCLVDNRRAFAGPGSLDMATYPFGSDDPKAGCDASATQGLTPGWADVYAFALPGQQLAIDGLPRGRYCLISSADPLDLLDELDEANNERRTRIALRPRAGTVRRVGGPCRV